MSTHVDADQPDLAELKLQLKKWEKTFAAANGGRRPGREDIKNDATISAKYKQYDHLRKPAKPRSTPQKSERFVPFDANSKALKERSANVVAATPKKNHKDTLQPRELPEIQEEEEPTPAHIRCALGPTPQKDGAVLGIFDALASGTPSKEAVVVGASEAFVSATPSKAAVSTSSDPTLSKTPQSSGKRFYLGAFAGTPLKRKRDEDVYTPSTAKRQFATPSFLRRNFPLARIDEESNDSGAAAPPFKKRGLVRSLSSIIQGLKKHEEEKMDDDWDVLNDLEAEERGQSGRPSVPKVLVEDSQAAEMPLGPDRGAGSGEDASDSDQGALDANGKPRKVWKKKGLKRQTRRVIMRPVKHKPNKDTTGTLSDDDDSASEAVAETQEPAGKPADAEIEDVDDRLASQDEANDAEYRHDSQQSQNEPDESRSSKRKKAERKDVDEHKDNTTKKKTQVSAQAHANFRRLKIKNKNSKASGKGRKFGRR